jgi:hypothetical protein
MTAEAKIVGIQKEKKKEKIKKESQSTSQVLNT